MAKIDKIYPTRQPNRPHHIKEWADSQGLKPVDLARELGADKSLVSRWYSGTSPTKEYQVKLAALFTKDIEDPLSPEDLFRPPSENWLTKKLRSHAEIQEFLLHSSNEQLDRLEKLIELTFRRNGTDG